jgi:putative ABC transport system permease protein
MSMGGQNGSAVFRLEVTPAVLGLGMVTACAVGLLGALFPAIRAATLPVATALRRAV